MKTKKFRYKIENIYNVDRCEVVTGFAVDFPDVRFCVRPLGGDLWKIDHYDTGKGFGPYCTSKKQAIERGVDVLKMNLASGKYAEVIEAVNRGEI